MNEKVFKVLLAQLEEAIFYRHIHKNDIWEKQLEKSRQSLLNAFQEQQKEIERLRKLLRYLPETVEIDDDYDVRL